MLSGVLQRFDAGSKTLYSLFGKSESRLSIIIFRRRLVRLFRVLIVCAAFAKQQNAEKRNGHDHSTTNTNISRELNARRGHAKSRINFKLNKETRNKMLLAIKIQNY